MIGRSEIPTLDAGDGETFRRTFYATEQPVLLRKVATTSAKAEAIWRELNGRIAADARSAMQSLCWDVRPDLLAGICPTPPLIAEVLDRKTAFLRDNHVRIWFNKKGHRTGWHYDGHSLQVFNLQLKGRKRWRIVAPETPLLCMPFTSVCMFGNYSLARRRHYEFETGEGDLLFVPRHWYHNVESLADRNVNVNWVLTPRTGPAANPTARREAELIWLKSKLRPFLSKSARRYSEEYAGEGQPAIELMTRGVSMWSGLVRGIKETARVPLLLPGLVSQRRYFAALRESRRLLRSLVRAEVAAVHGSDRASVRWY